MKVICIDAARRPGEIDNPSGWDIKVGEIYTVVDEFLSEENIKCFVLEEDPDSKNSEYGYDADRFIECSGKDAQYNSEYSLQTIHHAN